MELPYLKKLQRHDVMILGCRQGEAISTKQAMNTNRETNALITTILAHHHQSLNYIQK